MGFPAPGASRVDFDRDRVVIGSLPEPTLGIAGGPRDRSSLKALFGELVGVCRDLCFVPAVGEVIRGGREMGGL